MCDTDMSHGSIATHLTTTLLKTDCSLC